MLTLPAIGLGTMRLRGESGRSVIAAALAEGYRHIDTARKYENETEVGDALAAAATSRDSVIVTTKIGPRELTRPAVERATHESLQRLRTDHVDVLLVHWPNPDVPLSETLDAMTRLRDDGWVREIGVANFPVDLLDEATGLVDDLFTNQVEYHPYLAQGAILDRCRQASMTLTAHCPLARGQILHDTVLADIAAAHGMSPAQVALRWLIGQPNVVAIPRTSKPEHLRENLAVLEAPTLDPAAADAIKALAKDHRVINPSFAPDWGDP